MRVFIGYGYNERDLWIEDMVFELVRAFGAQPISGREIPGQPLEDGVRQKIKNAHALLAFSTRREKLQNGKYTTHQWVKDEIVTALGFGIPFVEVRESGLEDQPGMIGGRQHINLDPSKRDVCLVEIAKVLGFWRQQLPVKLQLLPEPITEIIRKSRGKPGFRCSYKVFINGAESESKETSVIPLQGGLFVHVAGLDPLALVQISVEAEGKIWTSDYESVDSVAINLQET
jgi:hypothetical protein